MKVIWPTWELIKAIMVWLQLRRPSPDMECSHWVAKIEEGEDATDN